MKKYRRTGDPVDVPAVGLVDVPTGGEIEVPPEADLEGQEDWEHIPDPQRSKAAKKAAANREES